MARNLLHFRRPGLMPCYPPSIAGLLIRPAPSGVLACILYTNCDCEMPIPLIILAANWEKIYSRIGHSREVTKPNTRIYFLPI